MKYRLNDLTAFSHALIYAFSPESSHERLSLGSSKIRDSLHFEAMQYVDMLNAYLYAQNTMLPQIRHLGIQAITPEQWLDYINQIHRYISKTILPSSIDMGYSTRGACRWRAGYLISSAIESYLTAKSTSSVTNFAKRLNEEYKHPVCDLEDFVRLSKRILAQVSAINRTVGVDVFGTINSGDRLTQAIYFAYHNDMLSPAEKEIVNKIVKVTYQPEQIPGLMSGYATRLHLALQSLDTTSEHDVSRFLATTFYELTDIHPFLNANGRTATCLINTLLVAMGYPSILIRLPGDRQRSDSRYTIIMNVIDTTREPFISHIAQRIHDAKVNPPYEDIPLRDLIEQRVLISIAYSEIWLEFPEFDADDFQAKSASRYEPHFQDRDVFTLPMEVIFNREQLQITKTIMALKFIRGELDKYKNTLISKPTLSSNSQTLIHPSFTKEQQGRILTKLKEITGECDGWKAYKNGTVILFQSCESAKVGAICSQLNGLAVCNAASKKIAKTNMFVAEITSVELHALLRCQSGTSDTLSTEKAVAI